jgi:hypothetical protein
MSSITRKSGNAIIIASIVIVSGLLLLLLNSIDKDVMGISPDIVTGDYLFGRTIGIVEDQNEKPVWIISGTWKTNLSNQTQTRDNSTVFNASFEMIKTDGTSKHTHTLTNFVLANTSLPNNNNNTVIFNGTSTMNMKDGSINDIPTSIQLINNALVNIWLDSSKIDNHFGYNYPIGMPLYGEGN